MSGFSPTDADFIRSIERQRLCALVNANAEVATQLHADDFQLINPRQCYWHIDVYEKCAGRWQVLWSQATGIQK